MKAKNARRGAALMYRERWFLRKCIWNRRDGLGRWRGLRNMMFPRLSHHLIYLRLFGARRWWLD